MSAASTAGDTPESDSVVYGARDQRRSDEESSALENRLRLRASGGPTKRSEISPRNDEGSNEEVFAGQTRE